MIRIKMSDGKVIEIEEVGLRERLISIIDAYGENAQLKKLSEEVYEFQEAVLFYLNKEKATAQEEETLRKNIEEEIADCLVILLQFIVLYDLDINEILKNIDFKVVRTLSRIKDGK